MNKFVKYLCGICVLLIFLAPLSAFAVSACPAGADPAVIVKSASVNAEMLKQLQESLKKCDLNTVKYLCGSGNCAINTKCTTVSCNKSAECTNTGCNMNTLKTTEKTTAKIPDKTAAVSAPASTAPKNANTANSAQTAAKPTATASSPVSTPAGTFQEQVVALVNKERAKAGLKPLAVDAALTKAAQAKAKDMSDNNYFSHTSPTYGSPFDMMKQFGISYKTAGENIAKGQRTPQEVMDGWMNSPGHRANILNASYTHIGVGYVNGYWVQEFIGK